MMPDLGKYAVPVLGSYGATLAILAVLIGMSVWRHARVKRALTEAEARRARAENGGKCWGASSILSRCC